MPKKYTQKVGTEEFKNQPIGLGPYRFVSYQPGIEVVMEAFPEYWRKTPHAKRLVMKGIPEPTPRLGAFATSRGAFSWIKEPEIDVWYAAQTTERDRQKRQEVLHKIQRKLYDEARFIPIWELGFLCVSGPRVAVSGLRLIPLYSYSAPFEDVQLQS